MGRDRASVSEMTGSTLNVMEIYFIKKKNGAMQVIEAPKYCGPTDTMTWHEFIMDNDDKIIDIGEQMSLWIGVMPERHGLYYGVIELEEVPGTYEYPDEMDFHYRLLYYLRIQNRGLRPRLLKRIGVWSEYHSDYKNGKHIDVFEPESEWWRIEQDNTAKPMHLLTS